MNENVFIIAEAGVNHNGDIDTAYRLIDAAKNAGADCVKFQTFKTENIVSISARKAEYQIKNTNDGNDSQFEMLKKLELSEEQFVLLKKHCEKVGIRFLSTAFDMESVEFLHGLGCDVWKIPSGEITNLPYLEKIAGYKQRIILSTGMADMGEIRLAYDIFKRADCKDITLLHCTTEYPAPYNEVNLKAMQTLAHEFNCAVGYSDHTKGIAVPIAAVAMGASIIEKHFTLDKNMEGPDHKASLEPCELKVMVDSIRHIEVAIGNGIKTPSESEKQNIAIARKSIVAKCHIKKGERFTEDNITTKRSGNGISPMRWYDVLGMVAPRDFEEDELIEI